MAVHVGQLEFVFEVRHRTQATQEHIGVLLLGEMRQQCRKAHYFHIRQVLGDLLRQLHTLFQGKQRVFLGAGRDRDDHMVEQARGAFDQIAMAFGNRVEGTWVQHSVHRVVLAESVGEPDGIAALPVGQVDLCR